jgi:SAM-dependent methyltransferase
MRKIYFSGSRDIKDLFGHVIAGRDWDRVSTLDFPAGSGHTTELLLKNGAKVDAWDMFPEFFKVPQLKCKSADLQARFPAEDGTYDCAVFQEGIEHVPDQLFALKEFSRILKSDGRLLITTPNYSNLRSRYAYLCFESETPKMLPPNEVESIWYGADDRIYYGHIFSIGIARLRMLARLAGLKLVAIHPSRLNVSSAILGVFVLPVILFKTFTIYRRALKKNKPVSAAKKQLFREIVRLNLHPSILFGGHLIAEFAKETKPTEIKPFFDSVDRT